MVTISAAKLRRLLNMVPDNTPVYIVGEHNENGFVSDVALHCDDEKGFNCFSVRIDYVIE